jgi:hypothetical protein
VHLDEIQGVAANKLNLPRQGVVGFINHLRSSENKIRAGLALFFPISFDSHIKVCDFVRKLLLNRSLLDLAGARIQRFFQALNLLQEFDLFRNNLCALRIE